MALSTFLRLARRTCSTTARLKRKCRPGVNQLEARTVMHASVISVVATPTSLWPPNGRLVPVVVSGVIAEDDGVDLGATFQVNDEYGLVQPSGPVTLSENPDGTFSYAFTTLLKARRRGQDRDGRQYEIEVSAFDDHSDAQSSTFVTVPHDQRKHQAAGQPGLAQRRNRSLPAVVPGDQGNDRPGHFDDGHLHGRRNKGQGSGWGRGRH